MSSRLMLASRRRARRKSSAGVTFEENMISAPRRPSRSARMSSVSEEQSRPQPSSCRMRRIAGLGLALTAKYSRKPGFQAKAASSCRTAARMPASS